MSVVPVVIRGADVLKLFLNACHLPENQLVYVEEVIGRISCEWMENRQI